MARAITITDPQTIDLIERAASRLGITETGYVTQLVTVLAHEPEQTTMEPLSAKAVEARIARAKTILAEIHPHITDEDRAFDYDAWLYDENGLPH